MLDVFVAKLADVNYPISIGYLNGFISWDKLRTGPTSNV
jgi:hypothetical protein